MTVDHGVEAMFLSPETYRVRGIERLIRELKDEVEDIKRLLVKYLEDPDEQESST